MTLHPSAAGWRGWLACNHAVRRLCVVVELYYPKRDNNPQRFVWSACADPLHPALAQSGGPGVRRGDVQQRQPASVCSCEAVPDATTFLNDGRAWALSPRAWSAGRALACRRHPALLLPIGRPRKPLTRAALQQIVKGIFRGAAHWLRQSAGSHMADQQVDLRLVHDNLGHASLATTSQCLHVDDDHRHRETEQKHCMKWYRNWPQCAGYCCE